VSAFTEVRWWEPLALLVVVLLVGPVVVFVRLSVVEARIRRRDADMCATDDEVTL